MSEGLQEGGSDSPFCSRCEDAMEKRRRAIADWDAQNEVVFLSSRKSRIERMIYNCIN